jgi:hypothetical protein
MTAAKKKKITTKELQDGLSRMKYGYNPFIEDAKARAPKNFAEAEAMLKERADEVKKMAMCGLTPDQICMVMGIDASHFRKAVAKNFRLASMLRRGIGAANSAVTQQAFNMAVSGKHPNVTMWWLRVRAGWTEEQNEEPTQITFKTVIDEHGVLEKKETKYLDSGEIVESDVD